MYILYIKKWMAKTSLLYDNQNRATHFSNLKPEKRITFQRVQDDYTKAK